MCGVTVRRAARRTTRPDGGGGRIISGVSISIVLLPLAVAAASAVAHRGNAKTDQPNVCVVSTRMRDPRLLVTALGDTGATASALSQDTIEAAWGDLVAQLRRDEDGIWSAHFTGTSDAERCVEAVMALDRAYGQRVQEQVVATLRDRAPEAGMTVLSQTTNSDSSITMMLEVQRSPQQ